MSDYYFPQDVLIDILTRLPAESLVLLTPVCKSWHSLITSPSFISHHLRRSTSNPDNHRLLVRHRTEEPKQDHFSLVLDGNDSFRPLRTLDYPFYSVGYSVVGSCNGLICLSDDLLHGYMDDIYLWNPSIRKSVAVPRYNVTYETHGAFMHCLGFGYDSVSQDFKVVRLVQTGGGCDWIPPEVEIYTLKTGRWRCINDKAPPLMICERYQQAYVNGASHWMAFHREPAFRYTILSFNMIDEVFNEISFLDGITRGSSLVVFKESLGLFHHCGSDNDWHWSVWMSVWIMKEYGVATSWVKLFRIDRRGDLSGPLGLRGCWTRPLGFRKNGEVIFSTRDGDLVSWDYQSKRITYLGIPGTYRVCYSLSEAFYTYTYEESLVLLNKLESPVTPVNIVVSGQMKKKKNKKKKQGGGREAKGSR